MIDYFDFNPFSVRGLFSYFVFGLFILSALVFWFLILEPVLSSGKVARLEIEQAQIEAQALGALKKNINTLAADGYAGLSVAGVADAGLIPARFDVDVASGGVVVSGLDGSTVDIFATRGAKPYNTPVASGVAPYAQVKYRIGDSRFASKRCVYLLKAAAADWDAVYIGRLEIKNTLDKTGGGKIDVAAVASSVAITNKLLVDEHFNCSGATLTFVTK